MHNIEIVNLFNCCWPNYDISTVRKQKWLRGRRQWYYKCPYKPMGMRDWLQQLCSFEYFGACMLICNETYKSCTRVLLYVLLQLCEPLYWRWLCKVSRSHQEQGKDYWWSNLSESKRVTGNLSGVTIGLAIKFGMMISRTTNFRRRPNLPKKLWKYDAWQVADSWQAKRNDTWPVSAVGKTRNKTKSHHTAGLSALTAAVPTSSPSPGGQTTHSSDLV